MRNAVHLMQPASLVASVARADYTTSTDPSSTEIHSENGHPMSRALRDLLATVCLLAIGLGTSPAAAELSPVQLEQVEAWLAKSADDRPPVDSLALPEGLTAEQAKAIREQLWKLIVAADQNKTSPLGKLPPVFGGANEQGQVSLQGGKLTLGEHEMPFAVLRREAKQDEASQERGDAGRALFFCLHGGGQNASAEGPHAWPVNTREWQTQVALAAQAYPADGIFWVPRMADDRRGRWWHKHNQQAIDQVIDHGMMHWGVDPNRVYLVGISEGGYGADILTPFMADRFAGASAMAAGVGLGNPPANLRNVAFRTDVGERDTMFDRQKLAVAFHKRLDELHAGDPAGYTHSINLQKGRGHGIDYRPGPKWVAQHTRNPFPEKIVWIAKPLDGERRSRFYWLRTPGQLPDRVKLVAQVDRKARRIELAAQEYAKPGDGGHPTHIGEVDSEAYKPLTGTTVELLLSDELLTLDQPLEVVVSGKGTIQVEPNRNATAILESLIERPDPQSTATQRVEIQL